jgi:hypothetical protein
MPVPRKKTTEPVPVKQSVKPRKSRVQVAQPVADLNSLIAHRAYVLFEQRGRIHGFDFEDWLRAEREILLESSIH